MPVADVFDGQIKVYVLALFQGYSLRTYLEDTRKIGLIRNKSHRPPPRRRPVAGQRGRLVAKTDPTMTT